MFSKARKERKTKKRGVGKVLISLVLVLALALGGTTLYSNHKGKQQTELQFVFVHGLSGWGSYDTINTVFPYWGLSGGSVINDLNRKGYYSYAASVSPTGSAWDRACELYAQLTGSVVDYGVEHSSRCGHERFGKDFSKHSLMKNFEEARIVLLGHSFGGITIRLFSELLINGSKEEQEATAAEDLSPFFKGGDTDRIYALVTLAAPTNGTTAYDIHEDPDFAEEEIEIPEEYIKAGDMMSKGTKAQKDGRIAEDYAAYDMHIDHALAWNARISTFDDIFYFAYPCSSTVQMEDGSWEPDADITESMFMESAILMSKYTGTTPGGFVIDEKWQSNDGLVNEISAGAPLGAASEAYQENMQLQPGVWYVMPTRTGDHMSLQGGMTKRVKIKPFYRELVQMLAEQYRR